MAIAYVGSGGNQSTTSSITSLAITYSSTAGNMLFCAGFQMNNTSSNITSIQDSASNSWTLYQSFSNGSCFGAYVLSASAVTSITLNFTGGIGEVVSAIVGEYSGVSGLGGTSPFFVQGNGNTSPVGGAETLSTGQWLVWIAWDRFSGTTNTLTFAADTGNLRRQNTTVGGQSDSWNIGLIDNSGAGSVTANATVTSSGGSEIGGVPMGLILGKSVANAVQGMPPFFMG
jgi:hypothetical protein